MDIESDLIKDEPESIFNIKSESEYVVSMDDIKTEKYLDIDKITSGTSIKQELDDMWKINIKKEEVHEVKQEPSLKDDVEENLPEIQTEEVVLKNESENGDSERGAHCEKQMKDYLITKYDGSVINYTMAKPDDKCSIEMYACHNCKYKANRKGDLYSHIIAKHGKKLSMDYISDKNVIKKYGCIYCTYTSHLKSDLNGHVMARHSGSLYSCQHCKYTTHMDCALIYHTNTMHSSTKENCCDQCDYKSHSKSHLRYHVKTKHKKQYNCQLCVYTTHLKHLLNRHVLCAHSFNRQYGCAHCNYKSFFEHVMNDHVVTKHGINSGKHTAAV